MLKIVSNNGETEVHSVWIDDGAISVVDISTGSSVPLNVFEGDFPGFQNIILSASSTEDVLLGLGGCNQEYIWAHVSGKL